MRQVVTQEFARRLIDAERECIADWLRAMEALPGNPLGIAIRRFGGATALVCGAIPAQVFNRVFGMTPAERDYIPEIVALYRHYGAEPLFDLSPYDVPPFWEQLNLTPALAQHGFYQGAFHQMLYGVPTLDVPPLPEQIEVKEAATEDADTFVTVY